jgi:hypothetical protein
MIYDCGIIFASFPPHRVGLKEIQKTAIILPELRRLSKKRRGQGKNKPVDIFSQGASRNIKMIYA